MGARTLLERRETVDGGRPQGAHLDPSVAAEHPLPAFVSLRTGDLVDVPPRPVAGGASEAERAIDTSVRWRHQEPLVAHVRRDMIRQLAGNPQLAARMRKAKPVAVDLVGSPQEMVTLGYPRSVAAHAAGLFWDRREWPQARIALRRDRLRAPDERTLVIHEYAHAIHYLGFTADERTLIQDALAPVFGHPADQDEVFAIYSEREFLGDAAFSALERAAPDIYGICRRQWREDHAFAAFVKKLYRPTSKVHAGDRERAAALKWKAFSGG